MSTLETSAILPHQSKKKKQTKGLADNPPANRQAQHSGPKSKKRGRQDNSAEDERPRKKRTKDHKGDDTNLAEGSSAAFSANEHPRTLDSSATSRKGKKKKSANGTNGTNVDELTSEGMSAISPELHEGYQSASLEQEAKKRKKRKDKQPQSIIPVVTQPSLVLPDIPIDPELLGNFSYDPNTLPFDNTIDFSTFGMEPGSSTNDILRAIKTMDLSTLTRATGQEYLPVTPFDDRGVAKKKKSSRSGNIATQRYNPNDPQGLLQKWLSAEKLKKLAEEHGMSLVGILPLPIRNHSTGLEYSKGAFTTAEKAAVQAAVETFAMVSYMATCPPCYRSQPDTQVHNISDVDVVELMFMKKSALQSEYKSLWLDIGDHAIPTILCLFTHP